VSECCSLIRQELDDVMIVVGGQAVRSDAHALRLGADVRATSDEQFHELLMNGVHQRS